MKKNLFLFLLSVLFTFTIKAQESLKVDAGGNQHFCFEQDWIIVYLGGNPTASGGISPYTYRWWSNGNNIFLDDEGQIKSNPEVIFLSGFTAYVEVTDAVENTDIDSVVITMSNIQLTFSNDPQYLHIDYYINKGDSVFLNGNVLVLNPTSTFSWSPCESIISDCHVSDGFWVKPIVTTSYILTAIDAHNCSETFFTHFYRVYVDEVGVNDYKSEHLVEVYPNPANDFIRIEISDDKTGGKLFIMNSMGMVVYQENLQENPIELNISHLPAGFYSVLYETSKEKSVSKFIKIK